MINLRTEYKVFILHFVYCRDIQNSTHSDTMFCINFKSKKDAKQFIQTHKIKTEKGEDNNLKIITAEELERLLIDKYNLKKSNFDFGIPKHYITSPEEYILELIKRSYRYMK